MTTSSTQASKDVCAHATSGHETEMLRDWLTNAYYPTYPGKITSSIEYLHTTINWTLTVLSGGLAIVMAGRNLDPAILWIGTLAVLVTCVHLLVRSAKGYINIMRWVTIDNSLVLYAIATESDKATAFNEVIHSIKEYHLNWMCPLTRKDVFYKLLFEFGYSYFFAICIGLTVYVAMSITIDWFSIASAILATFFVVLEIYLLLRSPYMRKVASHPIARAQR
jgi:hypothetical protein